MSWPCYWLEPTGEAEVGLRRYSPSVGANTEAGFTCDSGYHSALTWLGQRVPYLPDDGGIWPLASTAFEVPPDNAGRWPAECEKGCGYRFTDDDVRQPWAEALYRRNDTGALEVLHPVMQPPTVALARPGAMWHAAWLRGFADLADRGDGVILVVRCPYMTGAPGGWDWPVDMPASSGGHWSRSGDPRNPPTLTVTPSIAIGPPSDPRYYHGFLQAGVLTDHVG